jgi:predicted HTH domain antitoxin
MTSITVDIPDELAAHFETHDAIRRALFEDFIIEQRQRGVISMGRAAELLDLTYAEFLTLIGRKGLGPINATPEELEASWRRFSEPGIPAEPSDRP